MDTNLILSERFRDNAGATDQSLSLGNSTGPRVAALERQRRIM
jgi:hypothetical protein